MDRLIGLLIWLGALAVAIAPGAVAVDSGGVFPWSYWFATAIVLVPVTLGFLALKKRSNGEASLPQSWQPHVLTVALLLMAGYALFQTVSLPASMVQWLSPGVYAAWTEWIPAQASMPLSVAPELTLFMAGVFSVGAAFSWCGSTLFADRTRTVWLLFILSLFGALHAAAGLWQIFADAGQTILQIDAGSPFGVFVNRNNAAMFLNISLASTFGLLAWRLAAVTGHEFGEPHFSFAAVLDLISDRFAMMTFCFGILILAGLFACGSRGGLAGAVVGCTLAIGLLRSRKMAGRLVTLLVMVTIVVGVLLVRFEVSMKSVERFGATAEGLSESILSDERLPHWSDALTAVRAYLPAGAGFGSYRYAHLPYQENGSNYWFVNADNLWLEWSLEAGLPVIVLMVVVLVLFTYAVIKLRNTPDPLDHGVATAGWYLLGSLVFSQTFDFGLLLAGSLASTALLAGVILNRSAMHGTELFAFARSTEGKLQFKARFPMPLVVAVGVTALASTLLANRSLQQAAEVDAMVRATAPDSNSNAETLQQSVQQLTSLEQQGYQRSDVFYGLARLQAALLDEQIRQGLNQSNNEFLKELSEKSNLTARLKKLRTLLSAAQERGELDASELFVEIDQLLKLGDEQREGVVLFAQKALQQSPLFPEPRLLMAQVDSKTELTAQESTGLAQFMALRGYSRGALTSIAELSATTNNWEQASIAWLRLATRNPNLVVQVLESAETFGHPSSLELVPEDDLSMLLAGESLLKKGTARLEFLTRVRETLERRTPEERDLRARWYSVIAQVYELEGNTAKADEYSLKTIAAEPAKLIYRTEFISRLRDRGDLIAAKQYCRTSLEELRRSEPRIEKLLEAIQADIDARNAEILK